MELILTNETKIKEVKKQFSRYFPLLKLEFFRRRHRKGESSCFEQALPESLHLSEVTATFGEGVFSFGPSVTVAEFEQRMQEEHGLPVQVFRKAGTIWLETVQTDTMTLEKQNRMGEASEKPVSFNMYTLFL